MNDRPMWTDPALRMMGHELGDRADMDVLEYGAGGSSIWLAPRCKSLLVVEHDRRWYRDVMRELDKFPTANIILQPRPSNRADLAGMRFDIAIIDGRDRELCVRQALELVKAGGLIVVDNMERKRYDGIRKVLDHFDHGVGEQRTKHPIVDWQRHPEGRWLTEWWIVR